ncbi:MAG: MerR family transcriptional regulator [Chloroflexi bacterium]|nr:MAG: MerR family transcriptional regulator [Chloroflexota bacterium]
MRESEPLFVISVASRLLQLHPQTLRKYEREGFVAPSRTQGNLRLYSRDDIDRLRQVKTLVEDRGVNLAGVQMALHLTRRVRELQDELRAARRDDYNRIADAMDELLLEMGATPESHEQPTPVALEVRMKRNHQRR